MARMRWRILLPYEYTSADLGWVHDDGSFWCWSPCKMPIVVPPGFGTVQALIQLHSSMFEDAVRAALRWAMVNQLEPCVHSDFLVGYGHFDALAVLLERSREACEYVLAVPDAPDFELTVQGYIEKARDMAKSARALHAALEALGGL